MYRSHPEGEERGGERGDGVEEGEDSVLTLV